MLLSKELIASFNKDSTIVVFGSYPQKGHIHDKNKDALASFTRNRVTGLNPTSKNKVIVITHRDNVPSKEISKNLLVLRIFRKNNPLSFLAVLNLFAAFNNVRNILIEYEFSTFGDSQMTLAFIPFLSSLKNKGVKITVELHQVLTDLNNLKGHLGYKDGDIRASIFNNALAYFYKSIGKTADKIIVLENHLKEKLSQFVDPQKIFFLPHGVQKITNKPTPLFAKKKLGFNHNEFIVLVFGYLTWYKGSDIFVKAASILQNKKNIKFIIAGGQSHNQKHKPHYQKWYQETTSSIKNTSNLTHTDFVDESKIGLYFEAADLIVFPYRTFMSSSGPLSLAFSYHKPFLLSQKLSPYLKSPDIKESIGDQKFATNLLFQPNPSSLAKKISLYVKKKNLLHHLKSVSARIANKRSYTRLGKAQRQIITS